MHAGEILVSGIFNRSRLLEIPFYQRSYVWKQDNWDRFLKDMQFNTATRKQYYYWQRKVRKAAYLEQHSDLPQSVTSNTTPVAFAAGAGFYAYEWCCHTIDGNFGNAR